MKVHKSISCTILTHTHYGKNMSRLQHSLLDVEHAENDRAQAQRLPAADVAGVPTAGNVAATSMRMTMASHDNLQTSHQEMLSRLNLKGESSMHENMRLNHVDSTPPPGILHCSPAEWLQLLPCP